MRATDIDRCRALPLFSSMSAVAFRKATAGAHLQSFPGGTLLLLEGDPADYLYVLLQGQVELHGTWNDEETVLAILRPVSTFILAAVVLDADALMSARTLERCEVLMIPGADIRRAMIEDAAFAMAVSRDLAGAFRTMVRTVKNHKLRSGVERLANYLVTLHASSGGTRTVKLPYEKRVLASLLAMTPENLSRAFAALQRQDVTVRGPLVTMNNVGALRMLAKPDPLIDNHAPRSGTIVMDADAEVWATRVNRDDLSAA